MKPRNLFITYLIAVVVIILAARLWVNLAGFSEDARPFEERTAPAVR